MRAGRLEVRAELIVDSDRTALGYGRADCHMADARPSVAELLTPAHNYAMVQLPGRKFPGVVFQGDSLSIFCDLATRVEKLAAGTPALEEASYMREQLDDILNGYLEVLRERGIDPPFAYRPRSG
jgi:hypothetical protein